MWNITDNIENYTVGSYDHKTTNGRGTVLQAINPATTLRCYDGPTNPNGVCTFAVAEPLPSYFDALARAQARDVNDVESDMTQYDKIEVWGVVNTTTVKFGDDLTLKGIGGYRDFRTSNSYDIDASQVPGILTAVGNEELTHASYEVQLLGTAFDDKFNWVTGLYWYYEDGFQNSPGTVLQGVQPPTRNPFMQRGEVHNNSYSAFAQGSFTLAEKWTLTAGVRVDAGRQGDDHHDTNPLFLRIAGSRRVGRGAAAVSVRGHPVRYVLGTHGNLVAGLPAERWRAAVCGESLRLPLWRLQSASHSANGVRALRP